MTDEELCEGFTQEQIERYRRGVRKLGQGTRPNTHPMRTRLVLSRIRTRSNKMPKEYLNPKELFPSLQYGFSQIVVTYGGAKRSTYRGRWPGMKSNKSLAVTISARKPGKPCGISTSLCRRSAAPWQM